MEDFSGGGARSALELGFDGPGEGRAIVFVEDGVDAGSVFVFGVD